MESKIFKQALLFNFFIYQNNNTAVQAVYNIMKIIIRTNLNIKNG